mgnify:CR=1 FL=1
MLRHLPNAITLMRILLMIPFGLCLFSGRYNAALILLFVAAASDSLDGFLARRFGWRTWFGSVADPLADKLLLVISYVSFGYLGIMPLWLVAVVLGRDLVIVSGSLAYWRLTGHFEGQPTWMGKVSTFVAMTAAVWTLLHLAFWPLPPWVLPSLYVLVTMLGLLSAAQYIVLGVRVVRTRGRRSA